MPPYSWALLVSALGGGSLVAAISGFLAAVSNPAAPIVLPIIAGVATAVWLYDVYQNVYVEPPPHTHTHTHECAK